MALNTTHTVYFSISFYNINQKPTISRNDSQFGSGLAVCSP